MHGERRDFLLLLKPLRVAKVEIERERLDLKRGQALACQKALDGVPSQGVEVPIALRSKIHSFRHVHLPKLHGLSDYHMAYAEMLGVGGRCETEGSGTDNEQARATFHKPPPQSTAPDPMDGAGRSCDCGDEYRSKAG